MVKWLPRRQQLTLDKVGLLDSPRKVGSEGGIYPEQLHHTRCDLLITDVKMPGMGGFKLLAEAERICPFLMVPVMTA